MSRLPENVRRVIEKLMQNLNVQASVSGIGIFGSRSRGDAEPSSDVDLLIVDNRSLAYERVERCMSRGLFIDLNYIPRKWITEVTPPRIDQKLCELSVVYDRDWALEKAKDWVSKVYQSPARVDMRVSTHVAKSDIYLSRAFSACIKGDFQSACLFAATGARSILRTLIEFNSAPFIHSRFIQILKQSTEELRMPRFFNDFLTIIRLHEVTRRDAQRTMNLGKDTFNAAATFIACHEPKLSSLHAGARTRLEYYGGTAFSKGVLQRTNALLNKGIYIEAVHYLRHALTSLLENLVWLAAPTESTKSDYTTLLHSLGRRSETRDIYQNAIEAFDLDSIDGAKAEKILRLAQDISIKVRQQRKELRHRLVDATNGL